ncbi:MAG: NADH-quinone oxidoreductase subunit J [Bacteroidota bacterium]
MSSVEIMFYLLSGIIILFSILTVTARRILRAAVYLLFVLISTSGLYFLLNYQFLAAVQLTLYAGGIVVLIIFSILLTSHISEKFEQVAPRKAIFSILSVASGAILAILTIVQYNFPQTIIASKDVPMKQIGNSLVSYTKDGYVLPFEVISILLLAAMFGAIVIAKKETNPKN